MAIRLGHLSFWSLAKALMISNLAAWLMIGVSLAGLEVAGMPVLDPEPMPVPRVESALLLVVACLVLGAIHTMALLVGAWLVRSVGRGGPSLLVRADTSSLSRTFE